MDFTCDVLNEILKESIKKHFYVNCLLVQGSSSFASVGNILMNDHSNES